MANRPQITTPLKTAVAKMILESSSENPATFDEASLIDLIRQQRASDSASHIAETISRLHSRELINVEMYRPLSEGGRIISVSHDQKRAIASQFDLKMPVHALVEAR